ncbi:hypothetical protein ACFVTY_12560 [Streptomyces sp. NPDC058067]
MTQDDVTRPSRARPFRGGGPAAFVGPARRFTRTGSVAFGSTLR